MKTYLITLFTVLLCCALNAQSRQVNPEAKQFRYSTTVEKERPELNEATKKCIAAYRRNPSEENYEALKQQVEANYDAVIARKKAKLEELRQTAKDQYKIDEMQEIVDEVVADREHRIAQTMARFTDSRMRPGSRETVDGFLPVLGAESPIDIAFAPVTNVEYALFDSDFCFREGEENFPVVNITIGDALRYCSWLSVKDGQQYRLPTEDEWELAAGHMPKDADFNCGLRKGLMPVTAFSRTTGACGGIDFWGNCWEWTGSVRSDGSIAVKGGSWDSPRMSCRTEHRYESRKAGDSYPNVGFRIVRVVNAD